VAAMEEALMAAGHGDEDVSALARWFDDRCPHGGGDHDEDAVVDPKRSGPA
jgi:hypothetical protein